MKPFSFVLYVIPLLLIWALALTCDLFLQVDDEKLKKTGVCVTDCNYRPQYLPNGGIQWLLPKPWIFSIGRCARYHTGALLWPWKWLAKLAHFFIVVFLLLPWQLPEQYGESSHPTAVSSGFRGSPEHAALSNAHRIAPAHLQGFQNWLQQRFQM